MQKSIKEKAFADLLALGWKDKDAYLISGLYNPVYNLEINKKNMNTLLSDDKDFMDYLTSASRKIKRRQKESEKEDDISVDGISDYQKKTNFVNLSLPARSTMAKRDARNG